MPRDKHPQTTWTSPNALGQFQLNRDCQEWIIESNHVSTRWVIRAAGDWFALSPPMNFEGCPTHRNFGNWPLIDHHKHLSNDPTLKRRAAGTKDPRQLLLPRSSTTTSASTFTLSSTRGTNIPISAMSSTKKPSGKTQRSAIADVVAREYTIHMHKRVCCYAENSSNTGASFVCQD